MLADMMENEPVIIEQGEAGERLDRTLARRLPHLSRSRVQQLLAQGHVRAGEATIADAAHKVKPGEIFTVREPEAVKLEIAATPMDLKIVYEDAHLLVIDKPAGLTVHPAPGHWGDTLVNALLAHAGETLSGIGGVMRPGIVHRIDKDTSGLLVVAKHDSAHRHLSAQLADRTLKREYLAVAKGRITPPVGRIEGNIARSPANRQKMAVVKSGGRHAVTHYQTLASFPSHTLVSCQLETGRTHQIRVHFAHINHPLAGDPVYGRKDPSHPFPRQALHATALTLIHPESGESMRFTSELPADMAEFIASLEEQE